nr:hypothetical protein [Actinospica robiniae]
MISASTPSFGITAQAVAAVARDSIHGTRQAPRPGGYQQTAAPTGAGTGDRASR